MRHFLPDSLETVFQGGAETRDDFAFAAGGFLSTPRGPVRLVSRRGGEGRLEAISQVSGYCLLVPFQPDTRRVRNMQLAVPDLVWLLQNRVRPILPLEVAASDHAFLGVEIDQDQRPLCERSRCALRLVA